MARVVTPGFDPSSLSTPTPLASNCVDSGSGGRSPQIAELSSAVSPEAPGTDDSSAPMSADGPTPSKTSTRAGSKRYALKLGAGDSPFPVSYAPSSKKGLPDDWVRHALAGKFDLSCQSPVNIASDATAGEVTNIIYDNERQVDLNRRNRQGSGIITIDDGGVSESVWRCFTDRRVMFADIVMLVAVLGSSLTAPLCFIWGGGWHKPENLPYGRKILFLDAFFDVLFAIHLLLRLRTSFLHQRRRSEIVNLDTILRHHIRDPVYWLLWLGVTAHLWAFIFDIPLIVLNNLKLARPIKQFLWLPDSLWRIKDNMFVRLAIPGLNLVLSSHWVACVLSNVGGFREVAIIDEKAAEFRTSFNGETISEWLSLYLMSLVESIYMLTGALDNPLGEGSVREKQFGSLVLVSIGGPLGCLFVSYFISALVREQALHYALELRHEENKAFIVRALQNLDIPRDLQTRVLGLHEFQKTGHDWQAFDALFNKKNLSPPLELALRVYLYHDSVLSNSPYLRDKDTNYVLEVISGLEDQVYLPGDFVCRRGQVCSSMFFVLKGELSVLVPDPRYSERKVTCTLEVSIKTRGDYFGEVALIKDSVRTAWVRANTYVLLARLTKKYAEAIWKHYPWERQKLAEQVMEVARLDRERSRYGPNAFGKGGNSPATIDIQGQKEARALQFVTTAPIGSQLALAANPESAAFFEALSMGSKLEENPASAALFEAAAGQLDAVGTTRSEVMAHMTTTGTTMGLSELRKLLEQHIQESGRASLEQSRQLGQIIERQSAIDSRIASLLARPAMSLPSSQVSPSDRPMSATASNNRQPSPTQTAAPMLDTVAALAPRAPFNEAPELSSGEVREME